MTALGSSRQPPPGLRGAALVQWHDREQHLRELRRLLRAAAGSEWSRWVCDELPAWRSVHHPRFVPMPLPAAPPRRRARGDRPRVPAIPRETRSSSGEDRHAR